MDEEGTRVDEQPPAPAPSSENQTTHKRKPSKAVNGTTRAAHDPSPGIGKLRIDDDRTTQSNQPEEPSIDVSSTTADAEPATMQTNGDTEAKLETMARERSALRDEVAQLRRSLEELQGKHNEEIGNIRQELEETQGQKENADTQYRNLLGRVNTIKSQLGERLKSDAVGLPSVGVKSCGLTT